MMAKACFDRQGTLWCAQSLPDPPGQALEAPVLASRYARGPAVAALAALELRGPRRRARPAGPALNVHAVRAATAQRSRRPGLSCQDHGSRSQGCASSWHQLPACARAPPAEAEHAGSDLRCASSPALTERQSMQSTFLALLCNMKLLRAAMAYRDCISCFAFKNMRAPAHCMRGVRRAAQ